MDVEKKYILVLLCTCFTLVQAINAKIGLRFCQNSGTPVNGVNFSCMCHYGFTGDRCERYLGDYVLYWSFDTLENLTLMINQNASDFDSLVPGQVNSAVSTYRSPGRWINLLTHLEVCMTHPESCGAAGGAISLWFRVIDCGISGAIVTRWPSDGQIQLGRIDLHHTGTTSTLPFYLSVEVDELLIYNRTITEPEIILLGQITL